MSTPTTEPTVLYTGDTWAWTKALADYPADTWVLKYVLINLAGRINITAAADGTTHSVSVAAATTAAYTAGAYTWHSFVEQGSDRFTITQGSILVKAGYSTGSGGAEGRSQAEVALQDAIDALATYTASKGMVVDYTIGGRRMTFRSIDDIRNLIAFWRGEVAKENPLLPGSGKKILTRFGS